MEKITPTRIKKLMKALKDGLTGIYGDQLEAVYLYGSYVRGDHRAGSDVAAGRAYYALFYIAEALLSEKVFILTSMGMSLEPMEKSLPRQNYWTPNFTGG